MNNLLWMLARQFSKCGHKVSVCSPSASLLAEDAIDSFGIRHIRCAGSGLKKGRWRDNLSGIPYARRVWNRLPNADVTSFHAPFSFLLRHKAGIGVTTHTIHRTPKWIVKLYGRMDRIYAGSRATVAEAISIAPELRPRLKAVHNCIECVEMNGVGVREPSRDCSFIYVGRFVPDKGLASLIGGSINALKSGCRLTVTTIGPQSDDDGADSSFFQSMLTLVRDAGAADKIIFRRPIKDRDELFGAIDQHDIFCLPSLSGETFSVAALEAMARAKPLLTSDYGPMPEMVTEGVNGFIARAGDRDAWTDAISLVCNRRESLPEMGWQSYLKARNEFSVERIAEEYIADFRELIAKRA